MKKIWLFSLISGFLLIFAQPPYSIEVLIWIGFIPIFLEIFKRKNMFWVGFLTGVFYFAFILIWFWAAYPLNWLDINNKYISFFIILLIWAITTAGMAIWWGFSFYFANKINPYKINNFKFKLLSFLFLPSIFTLSEYLRAWFFGTLWLGSGTLFGPHWTVGNIAYSLHNNPLFLKLSSFIGIYGITFLIILINVLLAYLLLNKKLNLPKKIILLVTIIFFLSYLPYLLSNTNNYPKQTIPIAVIQTKIPSQINYPTNQQLNDFKNQLALLKKSSQLNPSPEIIIFPETTNFFKNLSMFLNVEKTKLFFENLFDKQTLIIDSSRITDEFGKTKSRVIYLNSKKGIVGIYDKQFLTPGGEFLPYHIKILVNLFSKNQLIKFNLFREFSKGEKPAQLPENNMQPGALVCAELFSPNLFRKLSNQNPNFLIVLASTGIFKGNKNLIKQNIAMSKFRAAENNKYLVLAANYGRSFIVSNKGILGKITENKKEQLFTADIVSLKNTTWYNKLGDYPILMLSLAIILTLTIATKRRRICS